MAGLLNKIFTAKPLALSVIHDQRINLRVVDSQIKDWTTKIMA